MQKPHPPILLGGETKYTLKRVVDFCDGWFPRLRGGDPKPAMARLRQAADEGGRDMKTISTTLFGTPDNAEYIESCREAGLDRLLFALPSESGDALLPRLDELAALIS
jgi:alkanesulfonate monooxygenase SsuD/methylene tetrahydromethanopterin reductase-like flavin-dependent oxidoreductase (luciferase family)